MVPNPNVETLIMAILGFSTITLIMLLPTFLELKNPKDSGPRLVGDKRVSQQLLHAAKAKGMVDLEEKQVFDQSLIRKLADIIAVLPNVEG